MRRVRPKTTTRTPTKQTRSLYVKQFQALDMLKEKSIAVRETAPSKGDFFVTLTVDRTSLSPSILASSTADFEPSLTGRFPFPYANPNLGAGSSLLKAVGAHLHTPDEAFENLAQLIQSLWQIFKEKEGFLLEVRANLSTNGLEVRGARFGFDDAAYKSSGRQEALHKLRNKAEEVPEEVEAEKDGIVYVKYVSRILTMATADSFIEIQVGR